MSGARITIQQQEIYMQMRKKRIRQAMAAAKAGISERSGRNIERGKNKGEAAQVRTWKTRQDPFADIWVSEIVPLLERGVYQATFILEELQKKHAEGFDNSVLRTLQRKIKRWRALYGKEKSVIFLQAHEPGQLGVSDFTHLKDIVITLNSEPFEHILYHFRLPFSGWNYVQVFRGSGEPFTAFAQGLQEALCSLGGVPAKHRTDSLSASFRNLDRNAMDDLTVRYAAFVEHYGMEATRINPGEAHENGTIESSHRHVKDRIIQALRVRGSTDFKSLDEYRIFIQDVIRQHNCRHAKNIEIERAALQPLPATKAADYTEVIAVVSSTSTIDVKRVTYTVPSRLIGTRLNVKIYHDKLECYLGATQTLVLNRQHIPAHGKRARVINYVHVIGSLVQKPGAFRNCRFRNDLLPNDNYRFIWNHVEQIMHPKESAKFIVGLLHIAATYNCETELAASVIELINSGQQLKLTVLQDAFSTQRKCTLPVVRVAQHNIAAYNQLIPGFQQEAKL